MAHHAYFAAGERGAAVAASRSFAERELGESIPALDILYFAFELFSVDDARRLIGTASTSGIGGKKVIIASMSRMFHEAQNALLKILEEPPEGTSIILCVPSEGVFIPTLRSRLLPIPGFGGGATPSTSASEFLAASAGEREKVIVKLLEQAKSDKDEVKQDARRRAIELLQGLTEATYEKLHKAKEGPEKEQALELLEDLTAFTPVLYERSASLKLIFEHLMLVV